MPVLLLFLLVLIPVKVLVPSVVLSMLQRSLLLSVLLPLSYVLKLLLLLEMMSLVSVLLLLFAITDVSCGTITFALSRNTTMAPTNCSVFVVVKSASAAATNCRVADASDISIVYQTIYHLYCKVNAMGESKIVCLTICVGNSKYDLILALYCGVRTILEDKIIVVLRVPLFLSILSVNVSTLCYTLAIMTDALIEKLWNKQRLRPIIQSLIFRKAVVIGKWLYVICGML